MKPDDVAVSRRGNLVVIEHSKFEIKFNLSKGTWDYIDESGDTIIRNGCAQITLDDGSVIKTEDAGNSEFITAFPQTDVFGTYYQICFSHEAKGKDIRINTYLNCYPTQPAILLKVGVENLNQERPVQLENLTVLGVSTNRGAVLIGKAPADCHLFINMPPISPGVSRRLYDGFLLSETDTRHPCHDGVLHDTKSGKTFVFGFLTTEKWWPRIQIGCRGKSASNSKSYKRTSTAGANPWALYHLCKQRCDFGEEITSETVYLNFSGSAAACYEHYTQMLALKNDCAEPHASPASDRPITAWNLSPAQLSMDANTILTQTDELTENRFFQPNFLGGINYIQLDPGLASRFGTYVLNGEDPEAQTVSNNLRAVLSHIETKGFKTTVRINPFCAVPDSELVQKHPDYCIQEAAVARNGRRKSRRHSERNGYKPATTHLSEGSTEVALLDVSHPEVRQHIRKQIKQIVNEYGCSLINVDFTAYTTVLTNSEHNLHWHDKTLTSVQLYRLAGELLTDAIKEARSENTSTEKEVLLAGYNAVTGPCLGNMSLNAPLLNPPFSSVATSNRINDPWHHPRGTKHRLSRYAAHIREHNFLWQHVFGELAVDEPRPVNEAIVEMTAAALSGGAVFCSDRLTALTASRAADLARIFPLLGNAAKPVDLYDEPFPRIWSLPISTPNEAWHLVAVFNWNDHEDDAYFELDVLGLGESKEYLVHDFWMRQYLGKISHSLDLLNIPPRSVKLLCFREEQSVPQLLATDMHYAQGAVEILSAGWDGHSQSYLLVCQPLRQVDSTCFIHVPAGYLPVGVATYGSDYQYKWDAPICQLTFARTQPDKLVQASIQFTKTSGGSSGRRGL